MFWLVLVMTIACLNAAPECQAQAAWEPLIGIPEPEFGIFETYRMYDEPANRNPALTYTQNTEGGYYTHYVDNTDPSATDTDNPYGTVSKPRLRIPFTVVAGSVVEIHNTLAYNEYGSYITGEGTVEMPIFVRGVDDPRLEHMLYVGAHANTQYLIVEGLSAKIGRVLSRNDPYEYTTAYISVRDCDFYGDDDSGGFGVRSESDNLIHDVVVYNNKFHDNGIWDPNLSTGDRDIGATFIGKGASNIWFVDNEVYHVESTGIIITAGNTEPSNLTHHVYIGRNISHHNKQDGFWTKNAQDVVFSENVAYGHVPSSSSLGAGFGYQYDPKRIWYIFNESYDNAYGFRSGSTNYNLREEMYILGNIVHDCSYGIWLSNAQAGKPDTVASNTIYDIENDGIGSSDYSVEIDIKNNIIANVGNRHLNLGGNNCTIDYSLLDTPISIYWNQHTYSDLASFQNGEGEGSGCIEVDPQFIDAANNEFSLQPSSPAIDAGTISDVYQTFFDLYGIDIRKDIEGRTRPQGSAWDIGAYEYMLSAITDLAVSGASQNSVTVVWTVPGEEGIASRPGRYDIRYATSLITGANWDAATQVQGEPYPGDFGEEQSFTITALDPNTTYYIAIKTSNDTGSTTSSLSDVILTITPGSGNHAPVLELIGNKSVMEGVNLTFVISATDADVGDTLTYSATDVPTGASFNPDTRTFTWTPSSSQSGIYHVTFQVTDGQVTVTETITITVTGVQSTLTISSTSGGSVTNPGEGDFQYDDGATVSIQATAAENYHFVNWTGTAVDAGKVGNSDNVNTVVTVDADYTVQANFAIDQHTLTISSTSGGSVTNPGEGPFQYDYGTDVSIQATSGGSGYFVNWTGTAVAAGKVANPNSAGTTVTVDADYTIQANFGESDGAAPTITNRSPDVNDFQVPLNSVIILHVTDTLGVAAGSVTITLDGDTIYTGGTSEYNSAAGICRRTGTPADFTYVYQSNEAFDYDQLMTVDVSAADLGGYGMTESYSFTTEMRSFGQNKQVSLGLDNLNSSKSKTVCDSSGNIWAVWHAGPVGSRNIYVGKLSAGADTFGTSVQIRGNSADQANPAVALGTDDKLYVVWQDNRQADNNNQGEWDIYVSTSVGGTIWSTERRINDPNEGNQVNPAIVVDSQSPNYAHVAWQDDRSGNQDICIATSNNSFVTKTVSQITSNTANQTAPAIAVDSSNTVYVLWTDARNSSNDIYGAAGSPWTNVPIVTKAASQSNPAIAVESAGTILHMLWVDQTSGNSDIYYAPSDGLPGSPLTGINLIDDTLGKEQVSPAIAVIGSTGDDLQVFACWHDERNISGNRGDTDLYMVQTNSGVGTNVFVGDGDTNSDQIEPAISTDQYGYPYLVWTDDRGRYTEIYFAGSNYMQSTPLVSGLITASSGGTVGTNPNSITDVDDVSIVVPAGACPFDVTISITRIENPHDYDMPLLNGFDFSPSGIEFTIPVTITIPFAVTGAAGRPKAYWYNSRTGALSQQGITDVEVIELTSSLHALRFKTTHLTPFYALLAAAGGGGGGGGGGCSLSHSQDVSIVGYFLPYGILALFMFILKWRDRKYKHKRDSAEKTPSS